MAPDPASWADRLARVFITPDDPAVRGLLPTLIGRAFDRGATAVMFREKSAKERDFLDLAHQAAAVVRARGGFLIVNERPGVAAEVHADALHLSGRNALTDRAAGVGKVGGSVHSAREIAAARAAGLDYVMLGPVFSTPKAHGPVVPLGWAGFFNLAREARCPVIAVGGLHVNDLDVARANGAVGVAAIRSFRD